MSDGLAPIFPAELTAVLSFQLIRQEGWPLVLTLLNLGISGVLSFVLSFELGRLISLLPGIRNQRAVMFLANMISHYPFVILVLARLIPGLRLLVLIGAASAGLSRRQVTLASITGSLIWASAMAAFLYQSRHAAPWQCYITELYCAVAVASSLIALIILACTLKTPHNQEYESEVAGP